MPAPRSHDAIGLTPLEIEICMAARTFPRFAERCAGIQLRPYQLEAAQAVLNSIRLGRGDTIVVMMSRQSGKDELAANLKAYLLSRFTYEESSIVEVNPTYRPQAINAIDRLDARLQYNLLTRFHWQKRGEYIRTFGRSRLTFLSGAKSANVVGATASLLLVVNEAQDISPAVYDCKFAPMVASTNATRLFLGTAWTRDTLLARELRLAIAAQFRDGRQRFFMYNADDVRRVVPAYGAYVDGEIRRLGRDHPFIRTQYFNEELDARSGMFNAAALARIFGAQPQAASAQPRPGGIYAFCIDVGGQHAPGADADITTHDATSLSILSIDLSSLDLLQAPSYRVVQRLQWTGASHLAVFAQLKALADVWHPQHIVIDATGVGEGLWAMLDRAFPSRLIPVKFSAASKSDIGYRFLAIINTGRFQDWSAGSDGLATAAQASFASRAQAEAQYRLCECEVRTDPHKSMRWGVPEAARDVNGELVHDDLLLADSLVAVLDRLEWRERFDPFIIPGRDPLADMTGF